MSISQSYPTIIEQVPYLFNFVLLIEVCWRPIISSSRIQQSCVCVCVILLFTVRDRRFVLILFFKDFHIFLCVCVCPILFFFFFFVHFNRHYVGSSQKDIHISRSFGWMSYGRVAHLFPAVRVRDEPTGVTDHKFPNRRRPTEMNRQTIPEEVAQCVYTCLPCCPTWSSALWFSVINATGV